LGDLERLASLINQIKRPVQFIFAGKAHPHDVPGKRVTFAAFPWRWVKGDGCIVRLVAIVDPTGEYRIETGEAD